MPFHLVILNNKINVDDLKVYLYMSMGDCVFSRAKLEKFSHVGNRYAVVSKVLRTLKKNGEVGIQGTGGELGEIQEIHMANQLIFGRMCTDEESELVKDISKPFKK